MEDGVGGAKGREDMRNRVPGSGCGWREDLGVGGRGAGGLERVKGWEKRGQKSRRDGQGVENDGRRGRDVEEKGGKGEKVNEKEKKSKNKKSRGEI